MYYFYILLLCIMFTYYYYYYVLLCIIFTYYLHISYIYIYYVCVHVFFNSTYIHIVPETYQRKLWVRLGLGWNARSRRWHPPFLALIYGIIWAWFSSILVGWTSIYQLFWVSRIKLGHPNVSSPPQHEWTVSSQRNTLVASFCHISGMCFPCLSFSTCWNFLGCIKLYLHVWFV